MSTSPADFNRQIIDEFHANEGRVGGMFEGVPLLLLHHTGAKTGTARINPLAYARDDVRRRRREHAKEIGGFGGRIRGVSSYS